MKFKILTIFPEYFEVLKHSIVGRAIEGGLFDVQIVNIRDFSANKHKKTDDTPCGGGAGMVMTPEPIVSAIESVDPAHNSLRIYMSPKGKTLTQSDVEKFAKYDEILILCGNYEGVDQRVIDSEIDKEVSIGDYVLTGGEVACQVLINAVSRYIDGVLGSAESTDDESFANGLLEYPQYTQPKVFRGLEVPSVLMSGNHKEIEKWRQEKSLEITFKRRPDLLINVDVDSLLPTKKRKKRR